MCDSLFERVSSIANWWVIVLLVAANAACIAGFGWRESRLNGQKSPDAHIFGYKPEDVHRFMQKIGEEGRSLYVKTQLTLDIAFPVLYGLLFATLITVLFSRDSARRLVLLPLLTVVFDLLENLSTAFLARTFDESRVSGFAKVASVFTVTKSIGFGLCMVVVVAGLLLKAVSIFRSAAT